MFALRATLEGLIEAASRDAGPAAAGEGVRS